MSKLENKATWQSSIAGGQNRIATAGSRGLKWTLMGSLAVLLIAFTAYTTYVSIEPDQFDVVEEAVRKAGVESPEQLPNGYVFGNTLAKIGETLLNKNGGYLTNDVFPGPLIDNMPSWEFGAIVMLRDGASALRNHFARSQSQSKENVRLSNAEPHFYFTHNSWVLPSTEAEYQDGINSLRSYLNDLNNPQANTAHFFSRADNLDQYLQVILKRLGDYSYRLSASSVQKQSYDVVNDKVSVTKTPWMEVDNVFWEARGATWALLHIFKSIEADFATTLRGKAAIATLRQIIHELEDGQAEILSPVILNGDGFGLFANYSLTMANHIARANAATLDLRELMLRG
ncbi:MAG: DUF2333 family protein [Methylococcales bacterium]